MNYITLQISGLHAHAMATHLIIVLNNYVRGKKEGSIGATDMEQLTRLDVVYQKLSGLSTLPNDEDAQQLLLTLEEAEAFIAAFTEPTYKEAALQDAYYQDHSYPDYFKRIYAKYLRDIGGQYVAALAA